MYFIDKYPTIDLVGHELDHQETYQNGATVTDENGLFKHLSTPLAVFTELINEAVQARRPGRNPYRTPGMLEFRANQVQRAIRDEPP